MAEADALDRLLRKLSGQTVLVLGDVILDEYVTGDVKRISPEAPVPVVEFRSRSHVPGGAGNVAVNLAALGCRPLLVGVVGVDEEAKHLRAALQKAGVTDAALRDDEGRPTTVKLRILAQNQQVARLDHESRVPINSALETYLLNWIEDHLAQAAVCVLSDYGKGVVTPRLAAQVIALSQRAGVPVLVDPKKLDIHSLQGAMLVKPNKNEAERLVNFEIHDEASFLHAGDKLAQALDGTAVLITRGPLGMSLFRHGAAPYHAVTAARKVYDVTGAGDTVVSTLAAALAAGASLEEAVWLASQSAAIVVGKLGTASVTAAELKAHWQAGSRP